MPRAKSTGRRLIRSKENREKGDLNRMHNTLKNLINQGKVYENNAKGEKYGKIFVLFLLIISLGLIIGGGIFGNLYSILSGSILFIILWVLLK